ncbi:hypothetical protein A0H81_14268 [Grifola frondosa]|uniref:Thiamine pyrophosphate enzyme TPP-binding domain-containing protein n=1 Tax=Grifola frondosa TaxID=5627 RepID=A0A1C7LNU7_GRIFR|nr:hypothetical protein A0H81_14268 [Grifola frondosa]
MWAAQHFQWRYPPSTTTLRRAWRFSLPSAIGAKVGVPHKTVIDIDGDASFSMTMELATASLYGIGVKVLVLGSPVAGPVL